MKIAVLGYGPAGLIAAKTLVDAGHTDVDIIGAGPKSLIGGAQYLHEPILNPHQDPEGEITFLKIGTGQGYAKKVYDQGDTETSWEHYEGVVPAWALLPAYDVLWNFFVDGLINDTLNGLSLSMLMETGKYDLVFSSIPLHSLCLSPSSHSFPRAKIVLAPFSPVHMSNVVVYSGREEDSWYRTSSIFGESWTEFNAALASKAEYMDDRGLGEQEFVPIQHGFKPMPTNCDCHPDVVRIGRFGLWDRKILLHHVPQQVQVALDERDAL
jgi:hypothetical protein